MVVEPEPGVLAQVWEGAVPALVSLAPEDTKDPDSPPQPFCLFLPRNSYLPLATDKVRKYFSPHLRGEPAGEGQQEMWFSCNGVSLRWQHPVGVLYDLLSLQPGPEPAVLPWSLTAHFSSFPAEELLPSVGGESAVRSLLLSSLKEADQVVAGGRRLNRMQERELSQLWQGLKAAKFEQWWAVARRLRELPEQAAQPESGHGQRHSLPLKLHTGVWAHSQRLVSPRRQEEGGALTTLAHLASIFQLPQGSEFITQGIRPSLDTPLLWLAQNMAYQDNFIHLVLVQA